ncbi:MAG: TetR family transcriptional regulator, partial [Humibacillus sp.]|nr:TetR family transcriptional regulator [Humibacillus sp.]
PGGTALTCTVEALARDFAPVGTSTVAVPASADETTTESVTLRTTSRAVTGQVKTCS